DAASNVTEVALTTPAMSKTTVLEYTYDSRNRLTQIEVVRPSRTLTIEHDAAGQPTLYTYPSGITKTVAYGLRGEVTSITYRTSASALIRTLTYTYDDALQLVGRDDAVGIGSPVHTSYTYDSRGQLTAAATTGNVT